MWITPAATCHLFRDKTYLQTADTYLWWLPHFPHHMPFMKMPSHQYIYILPTKFYISLILQLLDFSRNFQTLPPWKLQTTGQWHANKPFGMLLLHHYNFGHTTLDPVTLGITSEHVYTTFFWTPTSHTLCQLPEDVLFGWFVLALNAAFTQQLSLADKGYKSGSDTNDLPTSLQKTPCILHVSSMHHASLNPVSTTPHSTVTTTQCSTVTTTPCSMSQTPDRPVH